MSEEKLKIYIVADFEPLRVGLAETIANAPDMEVIGDASSLEAMACGDGYRRADVLAIDVQAVNQASIPDVYKKLGEWFPALKVIFLGSHQDAAQISFDAIPMLMRLDTIGFLIKDGPAERLIQAIRLIACGEFVCETEVIKRILTRLTQWASYSPNGRAEQLSERETEVLTMVAQGRSNKEIARELFLSEGTIKAHISHIMAKLGLERRTELVRYALAKGVVPLSEE